MSCNFVFILSCFFMRALGAISPEIELTSAVTSPSASSTCAVETFTITSPYGVIGPDLNCSADHPVHLLLDGNETTWWQSMTQDENVTLNFHFSDSFVLSGAQLVFRSPLPQLVLIQPSLNGTVITSLAYAADCEGYSGTCYPLESIVDYEVNCLDISSCPQLVNLSHTLPNVTADDITYMFINMNTELLNTSTSRYYAIAEVTINGYIPANYYFSSLHSIAVEAEDGVILGSDDSLPLSTTIPGFSGNGYTNITDDRLLPYSWSIEIPRSSTYQLILRYGNIDNFIEAPLFTTLVMPMTIARNGDQYTYRFFIDGCNMMWCYCKAVGLADATTIANYQLEAGLWEISALMNLQNLILDLFIAIPEEFYNPVSLGFLAAKRFNDECGLSTNTLGRGTVSEYFCFQSAFILSYNYFPMLFECFCDPIGSAQQCCDAIGGQCPCIQPVNGNTHPYGLNCSLCPHLSYGPTSTGCIECNCINSSIQCNVSTGQCPCPTLVGGRQCSQCEPNTFGDPLVGCTACQCDEQAGTALCNSTTGECICEPFYTGVTCDQCTIDAFNDMVAGCQPCQCNLTGSINQSCSSIGECNCKPLVTEPKCTSCEAGAFYFTDSGCLECWCNGLTDVMCDAFYGSYEMVVVRFSTNDTIEGWSLAVANGDELIFTTTGLYLEMADNTATLSANISTINSSVAVYWSVPSTYVNMNWLYAYGASLTIEANQGNDVINFDSLANDVGSAAGSMHSTYGAYLMADNTVLVHSVDPTMDIDIITVPLVEDAWLDVSTGKPVTRPEFMSVLSDLSAVLLPAMPAETIIRLTSFEYGNASTVGNAEIPIEHCSCPVGHTGLSCQECMEGYFMSSSGVCILCQCNDHSTDCNPVTGECRNCQGNTTGFNCEQCLPCYINMATGSSFICRACDCSLTGCRNCSIDAFGEDQCACLTGYDGDQCDVCSNGYFQSPLSGECILSCGECVDKLVIMHNKSMQNIATLQSRLTILYEDLFMIYHQINNVTLQAVPLMDMIDVRLDDHQQLLDDLNMVDDCSTEVTNVTFQVNALWEQAVYLHNQISGIPNLTNNAVEAMSLYSAVSAFNATVFVILSQLESISMQANNITINLTEIVAINAHSYVTELNKSSELLRNTNEAESMAAQIERIARAHQGKLDNCSTHLEALSMEISGLEAQLQQLDMGVDDELQMLAIALQDQRLSTTSLFTNVSNNYMTANNSLQLATQEFKTAANLEQDIARQLQKLSATLASPDDGSGSGSGSQGNEGDLFQELSGLQSAFENSYGKLSTIQNSQATADANTHAGQLIDNSTNISSILVPALSLQPAETVRNFSALSDSIEEAANNSVQANETLTETLQQVMLLMSEGVVNQATQLYTLSQNLSLQVTSLNTSLGATQARVNQARQELNMFSELKRDTENSVMLALNQVSQLQMTSNTVQNQVDTLLDSANSSLQCVSSLLYPEQCEVDEQLYVRLTAVEDTVLNTSNLLNEVNNSLMDTLAIISDQANLIPVIQNQSTTNSELIQHLNVSVQALRQRMATARMAVASIAVALRLSGNQTYSYSLPANRDSNKHTQFSLIFRTVEPNGALLYASNLADQCVSLAVMNRQVVFSFVLDTMSVIVNNPMLIEENMWYHIFATRDVDIGRLSVTQLQGATVTAYNGTGLANTLAIPLMDEIYVGGASTMMPNNSCIQSEKFTGCVDTVAVNNEPLSLLLPNQGLSSALPCGPRPPVEARRLFDSSTWLLGGGSYVVLTGGQQSTDAFRVIMGFRTTNPYGVFFSSGTSVIIFLMEGQVWYQLSGVGRCEVNTNQRYDDNTWHYLTAIYFEGECSITVDSEVVTYSSPELVLPTQNSSYYIGGAAATFNESGMPFVSFAGCLRDVMIGSVTRNLTDNIDSNRVNFNGCPVNVTAGVRFNGEGYAQLQIVDELISDDLTNIRFAFKTTQVTGLLLELGEENNKMVLSLYHSYVRLEYYTYNTSSMALETSSPGYNDNFWHTVSVTLTNNMLTLTVDSVLEPSQEDPPTIVLPEQLTVGGSKSLSNVAITYRGCFRDLIINDQSHDFHNAMSLVGVSLFGCYPPAGPLPMPTSTVVAITTTSVVLSVSSDITTTISQSSIETMVVSVSTPLSTTATDMVITEQPTIIFPSETLSTPDLTSASISTSLAATPFMTTIVVSTTPASVVSDTPVSVVSTTPVSVASDTPVTVISATPVSTTPASVIVSDTPVSVVSTTPVSVVSTTPVSVASDTPVTVISATPVSTTPASVIVSDTPVSVVSTTPVSVVSTTPVSVASDTPVTVISATPVSTTPASVIVSDTPVSVVSTTPVSVVSTTPVSVVSDTPVSVISTTPVLTSPASVIVSDTPVSVVSTTPVSVVSTTPVSVISTTPVSTTPASVIVSDTPASVVSTTPVFVVSDAPVSVASTTPVSDSVDSDTPGTVISTTPVSTTPASVIVSDTPVSVVSTTPVLTTPATVVVSDTSVSVVSTTPISVVSATPVSDIPVSVDSDTPVVVASTTPVSATPVSFISTTPPSVVSTTHVSTTAVSDTLVSVVSTTPVSDITVSVGSDTPVSAVPVSPTTVSVVSTTVVSTTPASDTPVSATSTTPVLATSVSIVSDTPVPAVSTAASTPAVSSLESTMQVETSVFETISDDTSTMVPPVSVSISYSSPVTTASITPSLPLVITSTSELTSLVTTVATVATTHSITVTSTSSSYSPVSDVTVIDSTSVMLSSTTESSLELSTSTTTSSVPSSSVILPTRTVTTVITSSTEGFTPLVTTVGSTTPTETSISSSSSSQIQINTTSLTSTVALLSSAVLTTTSTPTPTPAPPTTLGLNGLGSFISLSRRSDIVTSYNIQLVFQTRSIEGILLYTASTQNGDYFALYLRNGLITYSFNLGGGAITVESSEQYSDGLLHNVTVDRNGHVSSVIIDDGAEVIQAVGSSLYTQLNIATDNLYVGGVSPSVVPSRILEPGEQSYPSVEACISSLHINNDGVDLKTNADSSGIVDCHDVLLDEIVAFAGNNSYAKLFESFSPITDFQLKMSFRSSIQAKADCNGLFIYIGNIDFYDYLALYLDSGKLLLTYNNGGGTMAVEYSRLDVDFCDSNWHEVEVAKFGAVGHLIVNGTDIEMSSSEFSVFTSVDSTEPLYIGGIPRTVATEHNVMFIPFSGCIRNLMLHRNGQIVPALISRSPELVNVNLETCSL